MATPTDLEASLHPNPALQTFRAALGINTTPDFQSPPPTRPGPNHGIYARTIHAERRAHSLYALTTTLLNASLLLQMLIAAGITALSAAGADHIVITVLGVLNTALAFLMTFMKGRNVPNRYRVEWNALRVLREEIEQWERAFAADGGEGGEGEDVWGVVRRVVEMYRGVRQTAEDNDPEGYGGGGGREGKSVVGEFGKGKGGNGVVEEEKEVGEVVKRASMTGGAAVTGPELWKK